MSEESRDRFIILFNQIEPILKEFIKDNPEFGKDFNSITLGLRGKKGIANIHKDIHF